MAEEVEDLFSRLSISAEINGGRQRRLTGGPCTWGGAAEVAGGWRLDPPVTYQMPSLTAIGRSAQTDYGCGGAHQDLNVGPPRRWAPVPPELPSDPNLFSAASSSSVLPWLRYQGGDQSPGVEKGQWFDNELDPFLLSKKPLPPIPRFPILNIPKIHPWNHQPALFNLEEIRGKVVHLAKDQSGCRILQNSLNLWTHEEIEVVLSEVIDSVGYLMTDLSGSYLIQKLFSVCSEEQRLRLILSLTNTPFDLISICLNSIGARAMQKILEDVTTPHQRFIVMSALSVGAVRLACDTYGHIVISYCLNNFGFELNEGIINEMTDKCFHVATNIRGCRMLQLCVENGRGEARDRLVCEILANSVHLSEDPYGNYVVQHLLEQNIPGVEETLVRILEGRFASLSCNKYSSNVVEKFFIRSSENSSKVIIELITSPEASKLLVDPYANYVIQKALNVATGELFTALVNLIISNASTMQSNKHGRKILSWFDNMKTHSLYMR